MNEILNQSKKSAFSENIEKVFNYLLPSAFLINTFINIVIFYIGQAENEPVRWGISWGFTIIVFVLAVIRLVCIFYEKKDYRVRIGVSLAIFAVFLILQICAFATVGLKKEAIEDFFVFGIYGLIMLAVAIDIAIFGKESKLADGFELYALIMLPVLIGYCIICLGGFNQPYWSRDLVKVSYMNISYTALPIILAIMFRLFYWKDQPHTFAGIIKCKKANVIRVAVVIAYWIISIVAGTRGAFVAVAFFMILLLIVLLLKKMQVKMLICLGVGMIAIFAAVSMIPTADGAKRMGEFVSDVAGGEFSSYSMSADEKELFNELRESKTGETGQDLLKRLSIEHPEMVRIDDAGNIVLYMDRMELYNAAMEEIADKPLTGMGIKGFQVKYTTYPHNFVLEFMADAGIIAGILYVAFLLILFVKLIKMALHSDKIMFMMLLILGVAVTIFISGSMYEASILFFASIYIVMSGKKIWYEPKIELKEKAYMAQHK